MRRRPSAKGSMPFILSQFLDACRWIGALLVLSVHATNIFVNLADIMSAPHSPAVYGWWFVVSWELGHQAVIGFFVMSGFLVGGAVIAQVKKRKDFLQEYLIHRFARIYMVTAPAIALTLVLDNFGRTVFAGSGAYDITLPPDHLSITTLLGNLANLQGIWTSYIGTNGPLWSLACEFWYYITFPLLLLPFARNYSPALRFGGFALGVAFMIALSIPGGFFLSGYSLWVIGSLATLARSPAYPLPLAGARNVCCCGHSDSLACARSASRSASLAAAGGGHIHHYFVRQSDRDIAVWSPRWLELPQADIAPDIGGFFLLALLHSRAISLVHLRRLRAGFRSRLDQGACDAAALGSSWRRP